MAVSKGVMVCFPRIDWAEMRRQTRALIQLVATKPVLEGVISMYDEIQDQADADSLPVLWLTDEEEQ